VSEPESAREKRTLGTQAKICAGHSRDRCKGGTDTGPSERTGSRVQTPGRRPCSGTRKAGPKTWSGLPKIPAGKSLLGGLALSCKDEATGAGRGTDGKRTTGRRNREGNEFTTEGKPNENRCAGAARHQEPATRSAVSEKEKSWDLTGAGRANREKS
jgi:hypothetical protein